MWKREIKGLAAVFAAVMSVYLIPLFSGHVPVEDPGLLDVSFNIMPNLHWMARSWAAGEVPLWNPHTFFGMPQLAYSHSGALYPVNVLLLVFLDYIAAGSATIIIHSLLNSWLIYLLMRRFSVGSALSAAAAVAFVVSGMHFGSLYDLWLLSSATGLLVAWHGLLSIWNRRRLSGFMLTAFGTVWAGFSGDVEFMTYGLCALLLMSVLVCAGRPKGAAAFALCIFSVGLGFLIMPALWIPTMEMIRFSLRGPLVPVEFEVVTQPEYWPLLIPTWLFPFRYITDFLGPSAFNYGLSPVHQGFVLPWLASWGAWGYLRSRERRPLAVIWAFLLVFSLLRDVLPFKAIFDLLPVIGDLHVSSKAILFFHALTVVIAFLKLSELAERGNSRGFFVALLIASLASLAAAPWCMGGPEKYAAAAFLVLAGAAGLHPGVMRRLGRRRIIWITGALMSLQLLTLAWRHIPRTDPSRYSLPDKLSEFAASLDSKTRYAVFEQLLSESPREQPPPIFGFFEVESGAANIIGPARVAPARSFLYHSLFYRELIYPLTPERDILNLWSMTNAGALDRGRMHLLHLSGTELVIARDQAVPYASPYSLLRMDAVNVESRSGEFKLEGNKLIGRAPSKLCVRIASMKGDRLALEVEGQDTSVTITAKREGERLGLLYARWLEKSAKGSVALGGAGEKKISLALTPFSSGHTSVRVNGLAIKNPGRPFQLAGKFGRVEVFENRHAVPRVFIVHEAKVSQSIEQSMEIISDPVEFRPTETVVLTSPGAGVEVLRRMGKVRLGLPEAAMIKKYGPHQVVVEAFLQRPGYLVLTDTFFPGWEAEVDSGGRPCPGRILPADLAFRALFLPGGRHTVTFTYKPVSFRVGMWASLASVLCFIVAPMVFRARAFC